MILLEAIAGGVLGGAFGTGLVLILSVFVLHLRHRRDEARADRAIGTMVEQWKRELS